MNLDNINFSDYSTPEELYKATGFTIDQAIQFIEDKLTKLREKG